MVWALVEMTLRDGVFSSFRNFDRKDLELLNLTAAKASGAGHKVGPKKFKNKGLATVLLYSSGRPGVSVKGLHPASVGRCDFGPDWGLPPAIIDGQAKGVPFSGLTPSGCLKGLTAALHPP